MGATAEERVAKRKINDLEQKLKKLQKELREIKSEKKHVGHLRKQAARASQIEADCREIIEETTILEDVKIKKEETKSAYRCKNAECILAGGYYKTTGNCDIIEAGVRLIVICRDCGSRYSVAATSASALVSESSSSP
jgi:Zn finger protein HypA/HybF involved in hydrogenase expression